MTPAMLTVTILGSSAVGAVIVAIIGAFTGSNGRRADAAKVLSEGATVLVGPLRAEVEELRADVTDLRGRVDSLETQIADEKRRTWLAVRYIKRLFAVLRHLDPDYELPPLPDELRDLIEEGA